MDGRDAIVTLSIRYGAPHNNTVNVATLRVSADAPVTMNELRAYGVEPITFSIVPLVATGAHDPLGASVSRFRGAFRGGSEPSSEKMKSTNQRG
jgi:hypothetical protein